MVAMVSFKHVLVTHLYVFSNQSDYPLGVTKEIAVCAGKIMFSDLRSLQLRKTMEIKVFVV